MKILFWICTLLIFYTYAGYPVILWLTSRFAAKPVRKAPLESFVSVIVSAYNEEKYIEKKIISLLNLDYPENKMEILIGSDGSSDQTDDIVGKFQSTRVRLTRFVKNFGKPHVLNALVKQARGEIIFFTDARQELERGALRALLRNFSDASVGCVSGELIFSGGAQASIGKGMSAYWNYEKFLRKTESQIGSMLGATGAIYAIRRHLYSEMPEEMLVDDMYVPLSVVRRGFRAVFESEAVAYDHVSTQGKQEFKRKVRTLAGNYQIFAAFPDLFLPGKSPLALQLFSHKFLRLVVPFLLMGAFLSNLFVLENRFYHAALVAQVLFYMLALVESFHEEVEPSAKRGFFKKAGHLAYTFCLLNYSAFAALFLFLRGNPKAAWEKAYA